MDNVGENICKIHHKGPVYQEINYGGKKKKKFKKEDKHSTQKILKWPSNIWKKMFTHTHREMEIKITPRYHFSPSKLEKIKKYDNTVCSQDCENTVLSHNFLMGIQITTAFLERTWQYLTKLNMYLSFDPEILLLRYISNNGIYICRRSFIVAML